MSMTFIRSKKSLAFISGLVLFSSVAVADTLTVQATADIYASGHAALPATLFPGDFPPSDAFTAGANQTLTFSSVTGSVGCNFVVTNGPDGTCFAGVSTTITSYGGLSGIAVNGKNMFLVGVFLDSSEPAGLGPSVLGYDYGVPGSIGTSDATFAPDLNQVFFVGDGLTGTGAGAIQNFLVPTTASRLYLGIADSFDGQPSFYGDNVGSFVATFAITQAASAAPESSSVALVAGGLLVGLSCFRHRAGASRKSAKAAA